MRVDAWRGYSKPPEPFRANSDELWAIASMGAMNAKWFARPIAPCSAVIRPVRRNRGKYLSLIHIFERILQNLADARRAGRVDHVGVQVKIQPGQMLAEDLDGLTGVAEDAFDGIGNDLAADSLSLIHI